MKAKFTIYSLILVLLCSGCEDFLDKTPQGVLSTTNAFSTSAEMGKYINQFYDGTFPEQSGGLSDGGITFGDQASDNLTTSIANGRIAGISSLSNAVSLSAYTRIRNVNFLLENQENCKENSVDKKQYLGEAYFFRAWYYFSLVSKYGDVTWINRVLPPDQELMKLPRDSRVLVIDSILADLDNAINLLQVKPNSSSMRVHKDVALAFKAQVALFEGTWQKYHKEENTLFYTKDITDEKIRYYLDQARLAALEVINSGRWAIHSTENPLTDYNKLFITLNLSANREILLWKKYNAADNIGHSATRYLNSGGGDTGASLSLIDDYLTRDGRIFTGQERDEAQKAYGQELSVDLRDPRLSQTVAMPGVRLKPVSVASNTLGSFPPINGTGYNRNTSGYSLLKFIEYDTTNPTTITDEGKSEAPAIVFRYAEVLLSYAEAVAELGGDPQLIAGALKPLRDRAGMPAVDFDREYNTSPDYPFSKLSKVIQVVRRERRIELANEGKRLTDILRWAAADELLVGKRSLGALFVGSNMAESNLPGGYFASNGGLLIYDTGTNSDNLFLSGGAGDSKRYIDSYKKQLPNGFGFKINRDYLMPIQERMLTLTGNMWVQNPGW